MMDGLPGEKETHNLQNVVICYCNAYTYYPCDPITVTCSLSAPHLAITALAASANSLPNSTL